MSNEDDPKIKKWANQVERSSWLLIFFGMLSQISTEYAFPSYNVVLGFWGAYCAFSKQARGAFVRWMLEADVHTISGLEAFNQLGYELHSNEDNKMVFLRDSD